MLLSRFCATIRGIRDFDREKCGTNREGVALQRSAVGKKAKPLSAAAIKELALARKPGSSADFIVEEAKPRDHHSKKALRANIDRLRQHIRWHEDRIKKEHDPQVKARLVQKLNQLVGKVGHSPIA
eukprot:SAG31_NODE_543_length_14248_cov_3.230900_5_plen_126_part_00